MRPSKLYSMAAILALFISTDVKGLEDPHTDIVQIKSECLHIILKPVWDEQQPGTATVSLRCATTGTAWKDSLKEGTKTFALEKNRDYVLEVKSRGYVTKQVFISTHVPVGIDLGEPFTFDFEVEMEALPWRTDAEAMVLPVAYIAWSYMEECFLNDRRYTARVKRMLRGQGSAKPGTGAFAPVVD